jgi:deazaflavin-dependent oxidoreductase (nitroreductase family)
VTSTNAVADALRRGGLCHITTTGRRSGQPRRVELAFHNVDGTIVLSGRPGFPRGWVANIRANPHLTFHLVRGIEADLPATGRVVTDVAERERLLAPVARAWRIDLGLMVRSSPLVVLSIPGVRVEAEAAARATA